MLQKILVTGAPGNVGSEVVKGLVGKAPFRIGAYRVERAAKLLGDDLEYVHFDFINPTTYAPSFDGVSKMFMVRPPALGNVKRDIAPALAAARQAGVEHLVFLSIQGVEKNPIVPHHKIEKLIVDLGFAYTFLRASFFMQNLSSTHTADIRDHDMIALPVGDAKTSFIDVRDIGAIAVQALTEPRHENKKYTLTGPEALDYDEVAAIMSAILGRSIRYTRPSVIHFVRHEVACGRPLSMALVMAGLYTITRFGNANEVTEEAYQILGRTPITFEQFARDYRNSWLPQVEQKEVHSAISLSEKSL